MRLSTNQVFNSHVSSYNKGYAELAKTHQQITTGVRIQTPADDPVGSARLLQLEQQSNLLGQYKANMVDATNSLTQEESILKSMINVAQRARDLAGHAGNGSYGDHEREAIAAELKQIENELFGLMNSKNASGEYWFSGSQSGVQPFVRNPDGTYSYQGDHSQQYLQVATGTQISISDNGFDTFQSARNVNRTQTVALAPAAAADQKLYLSQGVISKQRDFDEQFRAEGPYTLSIEATDPANPGAGLNFVVRRDSDNAIVETGAYDPKAENPTVSFAGVEFNLDPYNAGGVENVDLVGHSFQVSLAPDRFAVSSSSSAQLTSSRIVDDQQYAVGFPVGGVALRFEGGNFTAFDQAGVEIATGPAANPLVVSGVEFSFNAVPADGDVFNVRGDSQETQNILNTIAQLRQALEDPVEGKAGGMLRIREAIASALGNIDSGMKQIESTQAHIGARLNSIDTLKLENESLEVYNAETQSLIRDTDIAEATSRLVLQQTKLEAAQAAFMRVSQLSLFDRM